ncbi:hypothetical protein DYI42_05795 [Vannielia litorea]|nr:hypothetical protein [Vannielia litorea]
MKHFGAYDLAGADQTRDSIAISHLSRRHSIHCEACFAHGVQTGRTNSALLNRREIETLAQRLPKFAATLCQNEAER